MSNRIASALLLVCAMLAAALVLRDGDVAKAEDRGVESRAVYFDVALVSESTQTIGIVPPGKRLTLKDFWTELGVTGVYEILADGEVVGYDFRVHSRFEENAVTSFEIGFTIEGGQQLSIRRLDRNGEPASLRIAGLLEG